MLNILSAGFVAGDLVLRPVDSLPPSGGNRFVEHAALTIGGCAANASVGFARLLAETGGHSAVAGRVGDDPLGQMLSHALEQAGVDTKPLLAIPGAATAINTVLIDSRGERSFFVFPGACQQLQPQDLSDALLSGFHHLHLAGMGSLPRLAGQEGARLAQRARQLGLTISLDITLNPPRDPVADIFPLLNSVDLFLPNLTEAQMVLGEDKLDMLLQRGLACGLRLLGIKLGEAGSVLATAHEQVHVPAFPVNPVDTCGAGDAWSAAAVYGWLQGWPLAHIARFANGAGALSTLGMGATSSLVGVAAVERFVAATMADS